MREDEESCSASMFSGFTGQSRKSLFDEYGGPMDSRKSTLARLLHKDTYNSYHRTSSFKIEELEEDLPDNAISEIDEINSYKRRSETGYLTKEERRSDDKKTSDERKSDRGQIDRTNKTSVRRMHTDRGSTGVAQGSTPLAVKNLPTAESGRGEPATHYNFNQEALIDRNRRSFAEPRASQEEQKKTISS